MASAGNRGLSPLGQVRNKTAIKFRGSAREQGCSGIFLSSRKLTDSHFQLLVGDAPVGVVVVESENEGRGHPSDFVLNLLSGCFGVTSVFHEHQRKA